MLDSSPSKRKFWITSSFSSLLSSVIVVILDDVIVNDWYKPYLNNHPNLAHPTLLFLIKVVFFLIPFFVLVFFVDLLFYLTLYVLSKNAKITAIKRKLILYGERIYIRFITRYYYTKYVEQDRSRESYKKEIVKHINESSNIDFLLLSAYTMFYDDRETFIFKYLEDMSAIKEQIEGKKIRILLLYRGTKGDNPAFKRRGEWFVDKMIEEKASYRVADYGEYVSKCEAIDKKLRGIGKVKLYKNDPIWRLFIFDKVIYISIYGDKKDGHLTPIYKFPKDDIFGITTGFVKYYNYLWKIH